MFNSRPVIELVTVKEVFSLQLLGANPTSLDQKAVLLLPQHNFHNHGKQGGEKKINLTKAATGEQHSIISTAPLVWLAWEHSWVPLGFGLVHGTEELQHHCLPWISYQYFYTDG